MLPARRASCYDSGWFEIRNEHENRSQSWRLSKRVPVVSAPAISTSAPPLAALAVTAVAILVLTGMDAAMKGLTIAVGVYNAVLWRSLIATAVSAPVWALGKQGWPKRTALALHIRRASVIACVTVLFFWGLARLPIAEAIALSFIAPLIALYMAAVLLGERIGKTAIWASLAGMAGVIVIVAGKVGQTELTHDTLFGVGSILLSTVFYAYNIILMRRQAQIATVREIMFFQNLALFITLAFAAPWLGEMLPREMWDDALLATALNLAGLVMLTWAYARAEAQYLVPIEYTSFVWAILLGWFIFDEEVGWSTVAGAGLIVAGCLVVALKKPKLSNPVEPARV